MYKESDATKSKPRFRSYFYLIVSSEVDGAFHLFADGPSQHFE